MLVVLDSKSRVVALTELSDVSKEIQSPGRGLTEIRSQTQAHSRLQLHVASQPCHE